MFLEIHRDPRKGRQGEERDAMVAVTGGRRRTLNEELREEPEKEEGLRQTGVKVPNSRNGCGCSSGVKSGENPGNGGERGGTDEAARRQEDQTPWAVVKPWVVRCQNKLRS